MTSDWSFHCINHTILLILTVRAVIYRVAQNKWHNNFTVRIRRKYVIILSLKIPPHLKCVATLPCEMSSVLNNCENLLIFDEVKANTKNCAIYFGPPGICYTRTYKYFILWMYVCGTTVITVLMWWWNTTWTNKQSTTDIFVFWLQTKFWQHHQLSK